jgi:hypothetical protein
MPQTELRLEAVPEMGYDPAAAPPRGEVRCRSARFSVRRGGGRKFV